MPNPYYTGPPSDHFDGLRFFHPHLPSADKSPLDILRWKLTERPTPWPAHIPARTGIRPELSVPGLQITAIGHSSLLLQVAGTNILVDPVWSDRVSPFLRFGPRRHNPPAVALADLPHIHTILLTHNHYDHLDLATIATLWDTHQPFVLAPLGNDQVIRRSHPRIPVTTGDWWQTFDLPHGLRATIVPAYHWSSRNIRDRRMALWGGFFLETPHATIYCAGDTAYRDGRIFHDIRTRFGPVTVTLLPIGAYAPRWFMESQHCTPEEALQIAHDVGTQHLLGIHWNTFQLTDEAHTEPETRLLAAAATSPNPPATVAALRPGDTWHLS